MALSTNPTIWKILIIITILLSAIVAALFFFKNLFITIIIGICLILIADFGIDYLKKLAKRYSLPNSFPKYLFTIILLIAFALLAFIFWKSLIDIIPMFQNRTNLYDSVQPYIPNFLSVVITPSVVQQVQSYFLSLISSFLTNLTSLIATGVLMIPLMFYFYFRKWPRINSKLGDLVPKKFHEGFTHASKKIGNELKDFFTAKLIESIVIAIVCCIGFAIAGLNGWIVLGLFAGFINIVPYLGPIIGAIPALLVGILISPYAAIAALVTICVAQLIDNFYLIPFMISQKVKLDPLLSIILILVGAKLLGSLGMIFALPIFLIYKTVLSELYRELKKIYG